MNLISQSVNKPLHEMLSDHARCDGTVPALVWYGAELSYAQLDQASDAFAARLAALGISKGDPVVLFMNNCPQFVVAAFGIQKLGAIVCPCSPLNREHELAYQMGDLQNRVVVVAEELLPLVNKVRSQTAVEHVFGVRYAELLPETPSIPLPEELQQGERSGSWPAGVEDFWQAASSGASAPEVTIDLANDVALITYTSGTTGLPKGAMLTFANARYKAAALVETRRLGVGDVLLSTAPLYHIAGMLMGVAAPVAAGATNVILHRFEASAVLQAIVRYRVAFWYSMTPMNLAVMALPEAQGADLSSLRQNPVTSFGVQFTREIAARWQAFVPQCFVAEGTYGLSETHGMDTWVPLDEEVRWGSHGKALPGTEIRIVDPTTRKPLALGETGEVAIRSPGVFKGYLHRDDATAEILQDGWLYTGDTGRLDEDGYLTFIGRFKEMIKVSGYSVFPEEVEVILIKHPDVAQAAVVSQPDDTKGERIIAFIVPRPGAAPDLAQMRAWSRENMAPYKVPQDFRTIDVLPATGAGKVLRRLLLDQL